MQYCGCGDSFTTETAWVCKRCYSAYYCSPGCVKAARELHKRACDLIGINKELDQLEIVLQNFKPLLNILSSMLSRSKYIISLDRRELRMLKESTIKNIIILRQKMAIYDSNEDEEYEYVIIECEGQQRIIKLKME